MSYSESFLREAIRLSEENMNAGKGGPFGALVVKDGKIVGAKLFDRIKAKEHVVHAKRVVNCAGVHADELRLQDNPEAEKRIAGSRGTHLIFKKGLLPEDTGIIIPKTRDGRLLFICNYLGHPMVGTTDEKCEVTHQVEPTQLLTVRTDFP